MGDFTLDDLNDRAVRAGIRQRARQMRLYHLAKELGFSSVEAAVLQNRSEKDIRRLADERKHEVK